MNRLRPSVMWIVAAIALGAIAVWPFYARGGADAARLASMPSAAPVTPDYLNRDRTVALWERADRQHLRGDMLSPSKLSAEYLQRYRERGDIGDVVRALDAARRSLRVQPYGNAAADVDLASALVALHRFSDALAITKRIERYQPGDPAMLVREASIDLELGRYDDARRIVDALRRLPAGAVDTLSRDTLLARYDELTGNLAQARERFERTTAAANAVFALGAQPRAWFDVRAGELAFEAGDNDAALAHERSALQTYPGYSEANRLLARVTCSLHQWAECAAAARASAEVVPYPEVLGYQADAERALGRTADAAQTADLIGTVARIGNAQHVSDRLLAIYDTEHGEHLEDAYRIAKGELAVRDDVFTDDTLAWAAAATGRWDEARTRSAKALRLGTQSALLQYHAGIIALHFGDRVAAKRRLAAALALNDRFHPTYADDARSRLARL